MCFWKKIEDKKKESLIGSSVSFPGGKGEESGPSGFQYRFMKSSFKDLGSFDSAFQHHHGSENADEQAEKTLQQVEGKCGDATQIP